MKNKLILALISLSIIFIYSTCKNELTGPPEDKPGRRDYTWQIDTVCPYNNLYRLWGNSPSDVWVIGQPGDFSKTIYHFDGNKWSTDNISRPLAPSSIWGSSSEDVWIGGDGTIWHYNGEEWKEFIQLTINGKNQLFFDNMWGDSPNNIYAFGAFFDNTSAIAHFENGKWSLLNTDGLTGIVERFFPAKYDDKVFLRTNIIGYGQFPDSNLIYEYSQSKYTKLYSSQWWQGTQCEISLIDGEVYFIMGNKIAVRRNNQFQTILTIDNPNFYQRIWGRNSKDIFLMMTDGLTHYNGSDIEYLFPYPFHTQIYGAALFENDVFFLIAEGQPNINLIYHGHLKNNTGD